MRTIESYAYRVAGPRDLLINLAINSLVPWYVFREQGSVPLFGPHSVTTFLLVMSGILATATTFFGYLNGIRERKSCRITPELDKQSPWVASALRAALITGGSTLAVALVLLAILWFVLPHAAVPRSAAVIGIGSVAALLGYWLHSRAVVQSGRITTTPGPNP